MALIEKLKKLKQLEQNKSRPDWEAYKERWINDVKHLQNTIMYSWFQSYSDEKLMEFAIIPVKRMDPYIGEYLTTILEITLSNNVSFVLEPISAITSEFDGKVEFYIRGSVHEKVNLLRKIMEKDIEWIIAESQFQKDHHVLDKSKLEKIIDQWLS